MILGRPVSRASSNGRMGSFQPGSPRTGRRPRGDTFLMPVRVRPPAPWNCARTRCTPICDQFGSSPRLVMTESNCPLLADTFSVLRPARKQGIMLKDLDDPNSSDPQTRRKTEEICRRLKVFRLRRACSPPPEFQPPAGPAPNSTRYVDPASAFLRPLDERAHASQGSFDRETKERTGDLLGV